MRGRELEITEEEIFFFSVFFISKYIQVFFEFLGLFLNSSRCIPYTHLRTDFSIEIDV